MRHVFNLQERGEHPYCGPPLVLPSMFTYAADSLEKRGIAVTDGGWVDLSTPTFRHISELVAKANTVLDKGHKVAIHCHAGYGRTGLLVACILVHRLVLEGDEAVRLVRSRRPKCIQVLVDSTCPLCRRLISRPT